jgi:hypothetical protein
MAKTAFTCCLDRWSPKVDCFFAFFCATPSQSGFSSRTETNQLLLNIEKKESRHDWISLDFFLVLSAFLGKSSQ